MPTPSDLRDRIAPETLATLTGGLEGVPVDTLEEMVHALYGALRSLARRHLAGERRAHTLSPTALVHEAYLRLEQQFPDVPENTQKFMAIASRLMRQVLVDHARARNRDKRGAGMVLDTYTDSIRVGGADDGRDNLLEVDAALNELEGRNPLHCRIVECRVFAGLTIEETAAALDTSPSTVKRGWRFARAFLQDALDAA